jgi:carbonic anhydrase
VTFSDDEVKAQITSEVGVRPHFALEAFPDVTEDVRQSISRLKNSPFLPDATSIRGFVYSVSDGSITEVL